MSKYTKKQRFPEPTKQKQPPQVDSLLAAMQDGNEYGSIVSLLPKPAVDLIGELVAAILDIQTIRKRPCIAYIGNVVNPDSMSGIESSDDLPFHEMVARVPAAERKVDVILATNGGSAQQVSRFVNALRPRFDEVDFLLPSFCMSAGTIFALSGDNIWMTSRACMGPIDPQVPSKDGRLVAAQGLLLLLNQLQRDGVEAKAKGRPVPWTAVRIVDTLDKKELADAISASTYAITMAAEFLQRYKLRSWTQHSSSGNPVTQQEREATALKIATAFAAHDKWKSHGHSISREALANELRLRIEHPENVPGFSRALLRLWALCNWLFDKSTSLKLMVSEHYRYVRHRVRKQERP